MTHALAFVERTTSDLRSGRRSWRVLTALWTISLSAGIAAPLLIQ